MNTYRYQIADLLFRVSVDPRFIQPMDTIFRQSAAQTPSDSNEPPIDVENHFGSLDAFLPQGPISEDVISFHEEGDSYLIHFCGSNQKTVHIIKGNMDCIHFDSISVYPVQTPFESCVGEVIFRTAILRRNGFVIHSAGIECGGSGIIFSAPSGTGKSTQANLWRQHKGANVLNGDRSAIRIVNGTPYVYGTLWSGSSPDAMNRRAPLQAVVMLCQAPYNRLQRLPPAEAVRLMLPRLYLPLGSPTLTDLALRNLEAVVREVPVYLFECLPDRDAVQMVSSRVGV